MENENVVTPEVETEMVQVLDEVVETDDVSEIQVTENEEVTIEAIEENVDITDERVLVEATVSGCRKLNVRKEPNKDSEVVCVIAEGTALTYCEEESTEDFYKVYFVVNEVSTEGYCVRAYISDTKE